MSLIERLRASAHVHGSRHAIASEGANTSYAELFGQADGIAALLRRADLLPGSAVGLIFEPSKDYIAAVLGVLASGHVFMPLNSGFPPHRIAEIIERANCRAVVFGERYRAQLGTLEAQGVAQRFERLAGPAEGNTPAFLCTFDLASARPASTVPSRARATPEDACYIMATSGSTGRPKLILGSERGLEHFIDWETSTFDFDREARCSFLSNISFDVSLRDMFPALVCGGTVCVPDESTRLTPGRLLQWLEHQAVSHMHIVPTLLRAMFAALPDAMEHPARLESLRYALIAGEPLFGRDVGHWRSRINRSTTLVNLYGPSETTLAKFSYTIAPQDPEPGDSIPVGKPMPGAQAFVVDESNAPCKANEPGEIVIATGYMSLGYINDAAEQTERFVPNPGLPTEVAVVYRTGDLGRMLDSGDIVLAGRKDNQVKLHGNRIELPEIESALLLHPDVSQAAVAVKTDGLGNQRLVGYVVPAGPRAPSPGSLKQVAAKRLPDYMIPAVFVTLERMPLTHSNKIDRGALPEPSRKRPALEREPTPPANPTEVALAEIWKRVLDLDEIGVEDGFFEVGGTSMLALQAIELIRRDMQFDVPVTAIFQYPTIRQFAGHLSGGPTPSGMQDAIAQRAAKRRSAARRRPG